MDELPLEMAEQLAVLCGCEPPEELAGMVMEAKRMCDRLTVRLTAGDMACLVLMYRRAQGPVIKPAPAKK